MMSQGMEPNILQKCRCNLLMVVFGQMGNVVLWICHTCNRVAVVHNDGAEPIWYSREPDGRPEAVPILIVQAPSNGTNYPS